MKASELLTQLDKRLKHMRYIVQINRSDPDHELADEIQSVTHQRNCLVDIMHSNKRDNLFSSRLNTFNALFNCTLSVRDFGR